MLTGRSTATLIGGCQTGPMGDETNLPDDIPNEIVVLKRREIEVGIVTTLIQRLGDEFGRGVVAL